MPEPAFQQQPSLAYGLPAVAPFLSGHGPNPAALTARPLKRRKTTILLAEDDRALRSITHALLTSAGYEVWACCDGLKALQVHSLLGRVDLLVSDVEMPFVSGIDLALALSARQPGLRVVLNSGSALTPESRSLISRHGWRFLQKPFRVQVLLDDIRKHFSAPALHS